MCGKEWIKAVLTSKEVLSSTRRPVEVPEHIEKAVSPLWRPCDGGASVFMSGKDLITPF